MNGGSGPTLSKIRDPAHSGTDARGPAAVPVSRRRRRLRPLPAAVHDRPRWVPERRGSPRPAAPAALPGVRRARHARAVGPASSRRRAVPKAFAMAVHALLERGRRGYRCCSGRAEGRGRQRHRAAAALIISTRSRSRVDRCSADSRIRSTGARHISSGGRPGVHARHATSAKQRGQMFAVPGRKATSCQHAGHRGPGGGSVSLLGRRVTAAW